MIILQAYESESTPAWILRCMQSVREWAALRGYDYRFSPLLFDRIPDWFRQRCAPGIGPLTDLGRLCLMQALFDEGAEDVVWIDADVLVFDPVNFHVPDRPGFLVIDEVMVGPDANGVPGALPRSVNGAVLGATRGHPLFDTYRSAIEAVVRNAPPGSVPRTIAGPQLLTALDRAHPIDRLTTVGLFTPAIMSDLAHGREGMPRFFSRTFGHRVAAANLCHFYRDTLAPGQAPRYDDFMLDVIGRLIESRGEIVNRHLPVD